MLFSLFGVKDRQFFWTDGPVLAWVNRPEAFTGSWQKVQLPPELAALIGPEVQGDPDREAAFAEALAEGVSITVGSFQNDKALHLATLLPSHWDLKAAMDAARQNGWALGAEYTGAIY